jgi:hypothetical protein
VVPLYLETPPKAGSGQCSALYWWRSVADTCSISRACCVVQVTLFPSLAGGVAPPAVVIEEYVLPELLEMMVDGELDATLATGLRAEDIDALLLRKRA